MRRWHCHHSRSKGKADAGDIVALLLVTPFSPGRRDMTRRLADQLAEVDRRPAAVADIAATRTAAGHDYGITDGADISEINEARPSRRRINRPDRAG